MGAPADKTSAVTEGKIIAALASGLTAEQVARALALHPSTVYRVAKRPENARLLLQLRETLRAKTMEQVSRVQPRLLDRLEREADTASAKDIDALSRASLNLEKVASSISGENRPEPVPATQVVVKFASWLPAAVQEHSYVMEVPGDVGRAIPGEDAASQALPGPPESAQEPP